LKKEQDFKISDDTRYNLFQVLRIMYTYYVKIVTFGFGIWCVEKVMIIRVHDYINNAKNLILYLSYLVSYI